MRISEEVDALEVMGMPSLPFLVTTRMIAGFVAVVPLYVLGLLSSYGATRFIVVHYFGQSAGTYDHYFHLFLPPIDVLFSFLKVMVFAVVIILIHCYYGYNASGGPAGRRRRRRQGSADLHRRHQHRRLLLLPGGVGRHDDRTDRGLSAWLTHPPDSLSRLGNRAYGVGFILVVALLVGLSVASFQKRFTSVVMVNLLTDRIGSQLQTSSDVKIRGLIVGEVRSIETTGKGATLQAGAQAGDGRPDPGERVGAAAAQDAVR